MDLIEKLFFWIEQLDSGNHAFINESFHLLNCMLTVFVFIIWNSKRHDLDTTIICGIKLVVIVNEVPIWFIVQEILNEHHFVIFCFFKFDDFEEIVFGSIFLDFEYKILKANSPLSDLILKLLLKDLSSLLVPYLKQVFVVTVELLNLIINLDLDRCVLHLLIIYTCCVIFVKMIHVLKISSILTLL